MPIRHLEKLFYPRSVAVIGASNRDGAAGQRVMKNLLEGGFEGPIMPVSDREQAIGGVFAYDNIEALPITPDLAVLCSPAAAMPSLVRQLGERGTHAAILLADEDVLPPRSDGNVPYQAVVAEAQRYNLRILGPRTLGVMVPGIGLNASIAPGLIESGPLAFVSQSTTICNAVLDWARNRDIGFSYLISLGATDDVDLGDVLDYLGSDAMTRAILLYVESIPHGRAFMSAGRGASRNKPVLIIKAGQTPTGQRTLFGNGTASGTDDVYDAAIRRAGMLRVYSFNELFAAVETLARTRPRKAEQLAIVANGRGIAALAVDALIANGGRLATLTEPSVTALADIVSEGTRGDGPISLDGEAPAEHFGSVTRILARDPNVDAVLVLTAPTSALYADETARAVVAAAAAGQKQVLTSWLGGPSVAHARRLFSEAGIPTYDTPNHAVDAFLHLMHYRRNQEILFETPQSTPLGFTPATEAARTVVQDLMTRGQRRLSGRDASVLVTAYGIPMAEMRIARNPDEAAMVAKRIGFPVALKISASHGPQAGSLGGTDLFLNSADSVRSAAESMLVGVHARDPEATVHGFIVERMVERPCAPELMIRVQEDPVFGPVIIFGQGGSAAEVLPDRAVGLPPLNMSLARDLISRTRVSRLLSGHGRLPPVDLDALCLTLVQVSQMIIDLPEIVGLTIDPIFVDQQGVYAVRAQIDLAPASSAAERRLAIRPYPKELEETFGLADGRTVLLRPIRPEDEPAHYEFLSKVTPDDIRLRFFHHIRQLPHAEMARLTQIDYDREMAIIATAPNPDGSGPETLGVVRIVADPNNDSAEYAILIRSDLKGQGLGRKLMDKIVGYCLSRGTNKVTGMVFQNNRPMLDLVQSLGFTCHRVPDDDVMEVSLDLQTVRSAPSLSAA